MSDLCVIGQCLACGGRGGWWTGDDRYPCQRCEQTGWDPKRNTDWYLALAVPTQAKEAT